MIGRVLAFASVLVAALCMQAAAAVAREPARIAFVVGNADYTQSPLPTALNDAGLVAEALRSAGFDVIEGANLNQVDFVRLLRAFLARGEAAGAEATLFAYVAGYAFAFEGDNYFAAVDAKLDRESDIPLDTMRLSDLVRALAGLPARTKIAVVDAARRLPFPLAAAGLAPGLAAVDAPPDMLIGLAAAPGLAEPVGKGPYGPYATAIAEMVRAAGLDIATAFVRIRARTHQLTDGQQTPWHVSTLAEPGVLVPPEAAAVAPAPAMPAAAGERRPFREMGPESAYAVAIARDELPVYLEFVEAFPRHPYAARIWALIRTRREALAFRRAVVIDSAPAYWTYLQRYPAGSYSADAERRLRRLAAPVQAPPDFTPIELAGAEPPAADEPVTFIDYALAAPPPPPAILIEPAPSYFVDLPPPPPPLTRGGLPAITALPPIPRVSAGIRIPGPMRPISLGGAQSGDSGSRRAMPAALPGPATGVPAAERTPPATASVAPAAANGPPAPGSAAPAARPAKPAPVRGPAGMRPSKPDVAIAPAPGQAGSRPDADSAPAGNATPPAGRSPPAGSPPTTIRQSAPAAVPPSATASPAGSATQPPRKREQARVAPGLPPAAPTPPSGMVSSPGQANPDAPRPPGAVPPPARAPAPAARAVPPEPVAAAAKPGPGAARGPARTSPPPQKREDKPCTLGDGVDICR